MSPFSHHHQQLFLDCGVYNVMLVGVAHRVRSFFVSIFVLIFNCFVHLCVTGQVSAVYWRGTISLSCFGLYSTHQYLLTIAAYAFVLIHLFLLQSPSPILHVLYIF